LRILAANYKIMLAYNPKDWMTFIFRAHKTDTVRKLAPMILVIGAYAAIIAFLEINVWQLSDKSYVKNIPIMHTLLSFVISMLLVFRTNSAYDRWWEGRKLWGSLVNNSRNLALKLATYLPSNDTDNRTYFKKLIPAYAHALRQHLNAESTRNALFADEHLNNTITTNKHVPNQIALLIFKRIDQLLLTQKISPEQTIILNNELSAFTEVCGACERIKNTPIPYSYSAFIKKFIFFYIMSLPFGFVFSLGYYVIPVVCFIFYVLASIELIAEEIEDPFDGDANDLPMDKIANNIQKSVAEILG
jgi:ion channel-forming bestrophin family protein